MNTIAQIEIAWHLWNENISITKISQRLKVHRATVYRWRTVWSGVGLRRTLLHYTNCKKHSRKKRVTRDVKELVLKIRREYHDLCGEKIRFFLMKKYGKKASVATIYRILTESMELKRRYKKWKNGEAPKGQYARDVVQADTVAFGEVFAYTFVDTYTREAFVDIQPGLTSQNGCKSLVNAKERFNQIRLLQTDGGSEFEGMYKKRVKDLAQEHRVSRPYRKNEQSYIESFNRTLRKECLGWGNHTEKDIPELKGKLIKFLVYYNEERPHLGLGMKTPKEVAILSHLL